MKTFELRAERIRQNKSLEYMAKVIGRTKDTYAKKERGAVKFAPSEIAAIQEDMNLSLDLFNAIFFDSKLHFCKNQNVLSIEL